MQDGHKRSCWIWFIFPQILIKDRGVSEFHRIYAIHSLDEARDYLADPVLGKRLVKLTNLVLRHPDSPINDIMGWSLDAMKFNSSMTLFSLVSEEGSVFHRAIDVFFKGKRCPITIKKMRPDLAPQSTEEEDDAERSKPWQRGGAAKPTIWPSRKPWSDDDDDEEKDQRSSKKKRGTGFQRLGGESHCCTSSQTEKRDDSSVPWKTCAFDNNANEEEEDQCSSKKSPRLGRGVFGKKPHRCVASQTVPRKTPEWDDGVDNEDNVLPTIPEPRDEEKGKAAGVDLPCAEGALDGGSDDVPIVEKPLVDESREQSEA
jgi:uncharacterized protein (DUF1810 family)